MPQSRMTRAPRSGSRYSEAEIERGLAAVAVCAGNTRRAARQLELEGVLIPRSTLEKWQRDQYAERYARIRRDLMPRVHAVIAEQCEDLAVAEGEVARKVLEKFEAEIPNLRPGEAAAALRNLDVAKAVNVDKAALLRGQPTQIVERRRTPDEIFAALERLGVVWQGSGREVAPEGSTMPPPLPAG